MIGETISSSDTDDDDGTGSSASSPPIHHSSEEDKTNDHAYGGRGHALTPSNQSATATTVA